MKHIYLTALATPLSMLPSVAQQTPVHSDIGYEGGNSTNRVVLTWESIPTKFYQVMATTALDQQPWQTLTPAPIYSSNNIVRYSDTNNLPIRFYKVVKLDTEPPEIWRMLPGSNSVAVPLQSPLRIYLNEETGVDTNSVLLTVGTNPPVTLADPRLVLAGSVLTYTPATNQFLGTNGQTITNKLIIADTLGFRATNSWPLKLELVPILAGNVVLVGSNSPLTLVSTNGDTFVFCYTGASSGLTNGAVVVGAEGDFAYHRRVLSLTDDPGAHTVSLVTTQAALSEILMQGSVRFYAADFVPDSVARWQPKDTDGISVDLGGLTLYEYGNEDGGVKVETLSGRLFFDPDFSVAADFDRESWLDPVRMTSFDLDVAAEMVFDLTLRASWKGSWSFAPDPKRVGRRLRHIPLKGCIAIPIPPYCISVWAEAVWEFSIGVEGEVNSLSAYTAGFESSASLAFGTHFRDQQFTPYSRLASHAVAYPVQYVGGGSSRIRCFVEPKLTVYLQSLAGPTANLRPYLEIEGNACVRPDQYGVDAAVYYGLSGNLALAVRGWDEDYWGTSPPSWEVFNYRSVKPLWHELLTTPSGPPPVVAGNLVWIPCGTFTMGSPASEPARYSAEGPQTRVTLSQGFWMGKYEVTQSEYLAVMRSNPSYFRGGNLPVERVSWNDAVAYCAALTAGERSAGRLPAGYVYRLPTEAEWEYACRAGTTTPFHNGNALRSGMANFYGRGEYPPCGGSWYFCNNPSGVWLERTTSVGSYAPNAWGLYDMQGNVMEWCQDWYLGSLPGGSVTDPQGPASGPHRVVRGGHWYTFAEVCRSASRIGSDPTGTTRTTGFRVVLAPGQP